MCHELLPSQQKFSALLAKEVFVSPLCHGMVLDGLAQNIVDKNIPTGTCGSKKSLTVCMSMINASKFHS